MTRRASLAVGVSVLALTLAACDFPSGPGTVDARVAGGEKPAGAAVVEVSGRGIRGFEPAGDTRVYAGPLSEAPGSWRVVLVDPGGGELHFGIRVDDLGGQLPTGTVVFAADTANRRLDAPGDLVFRVER